MIPLYFPHTYLSSRMMQTLPGVFDRIGVYLPSDLNVPEQMQRWVDSGMLELRIPVREDAAQLAEVLNAFQSWADLQGGGPGFDLHLLKAYHSQPPYFDAPFASQIRTDIRQRLTSPTADAGEQSETPNRLFCARVFLSIAQQLDAQADSLDRDYAAVDARQQDMLRELQDDRPPPATFAALQPDGHEQYMLAERMQAWSLLAAADPSQGGPDGPMLFVTAGREVLEQVVDRLPAGAAIKRSAVIRVPERTSDAMTGWRQDFLQAITSLAAGDPASADPAGELPVPPAVGGDQAGLRIEVACIAGRRLTEVLGAVEGSQSAADTTAADTGHTVIVAVEPAGVSGW